MSVQKQDVGTREVNLALGGGGAKGFVHLGVLEEIATQGVKIQAIVGTSIGALIGAMFAHFSTSTYRDSQADAACAVTDMLVKKNFWGLADFSLLGVLRTGYILRGGQTRGLA